MFMQFDKPSTGKLTLHRRSKTISVLSSKSNSNNLSPNTKKFTPKKLSYNSLALIKNHKTQTNNSFDNTKKYQSLYSITQQIQRLINREVGCSQFTSYVERNSTRFRTLQNQNPEGSEFSDTFYAQKNIQNIQKSTSGFREPQYLQFLKRTQKLNSKSFFPHFNWKQKLNRMKNVGNYGHVYKNKEKSPQKKPIPTTEHPRKEIQSQFKDHVIDSRKMTIDPQIIISQALGFEDIRSQRKMSSFKRCHTSFSEYHHDIEKRYNQTFMLGQRSNHSRKMSQVKPIVQEKIARKEKASDKEWKFQPWDVSKDI